MMWLAARLGDLEMGVSDLNMRHTRASTQRRLPVQPHPTLPRVPPSAYEIVEMPREDGYHRVGIFWDFEVCPMNLGISGFRFSGFRFSGFDKFPVPLELLYPKWDVRHRSGK
jgi:hypothetical protein